jgi:hypothetical protein
MWEKDKQLIAAYRACMNDFISQVQEGDADYSDICSTESGKLNGYIKGQYEMYRERNPSELGDKQA